MIITNHYFTIHLLFILPQYHYSELFPNDSPWFSNISPWFGNTSPWFNNISPWFTMIQQYFTMIHHDSAIFHHDSPRFSNISPWFSNISHHDPPWFSMISPWFTMIQHYFNINHWVYYMIPLQTTAPNNNKRPTLKPLHLESTTLTFKCQKVPGCSLGGTKGYMDGSPVHDG